MKIQATALRTIPPSFNLQANAAQRPSRLASGHTGSPRFGDIGMVIYGVNLLLMMGLAVAAPSIISRSSHFFSHSQSGNKPPHES